MTEIESVIGQNFRFQWKVKLFRWKKGVAMVLCRSMGLVSFEDEFTGRSIAAKILNLKLNETLHLALEGNFFFQFLHYRQTNIQKIWETVKG